MQKMQKKTRLHVAPLVGSRQYLWDGGDQERGCSEQKTLFVRRTRLLLEFKDTLGDILHKNVKRSGGMT
jgi:hypothetical protein